MARQLRTGSVPSLTLLALFCMLAFGSLASAVDAGYTSARVAGTFPPERDNNPFAPVPADVPSKTTTTSALYDAVVPSQRAAVIAATSNRLSRYRIEAALRPGAPDRPGVISGSVDLDFVNNTESALNSIYFRLYANAVTYAEGDLVVHSASIMGAPTRFEVSVENSVLRVPLAAPLPSGDSTNVTLSFTATVPVQPRESYGIFAIQPGSGTWALAHWFPLLAGVDESGWNLEPVSVNGDPIFSNSALFDVSLTAPAAMALVTSGHLTGSEPTGGNVRRHFIAGPVRDFTIVAGDDFTFTSRQVGATVVTSFYHPDDAAAGARVLEYAVRAMTLYSRLYGTYPYQELNLAEVSLRGAAGVEFPKLLFIGDNLYAGSSVDDPHYLEFVIAHEVAHQWWYGVVGNNQYVHAFLDEGLAEYDSTIVYFTHQYDGSFARKQFDRSIKLWYFNTLFTSGDAIVDEPTDEFPNEGSYGAIVYAKAALGFDAIHTAIGDDAFNRGLRAYYERNRFEIATPSDLRAAFEEASEKNLGDLWQHWFETAGAHQDFTEADYLRLQEQLSAS
jgi:hypothetical protein